MEKIPSQFYAYLLHVFTSTVSELRYQTICRLILQQAMSQLDAYHSGIALAIIVCTEPPSERNVYSLRLSTGQSTLFGMEFWDQRVNFMGIESLPGYAVTCGHPVTILDLHENHFYYPACILKPTRSTMAIPIRCPYGVAGCLSICSTDPDYFLPHRQQLLLSYADLLALAFEPGAFYNLDRLELGLMPVWHLQAPYFANFQERLIDILKEATNLQLVITMKTANAKVWQQIEKDLLRLACNTSTR